MSKINDLYVAMQSMTLNKKKGFIPFLTIGDPNPDVFLQIIDKIAPYSDVIELGVPFSDPVADGPTIMKANMRALSNGVNRSTAIDLIRQVKERTKKPIVLLTYANVLGVDEGLREYLHSLSLVGVNGIIIADVPVEEIGSYHTLFQEADLFNIYLVTPTTDKARLTEIVDYMGGFLYIVSLKGVTGARGQVLNETKNTIHSIEKDLKELGKNIPLFVGFGISEPEHGREIVGLGASGIIVGSAIIRRIEENLGNTETMLSSIESFVKSMKKALN